ncbi:tetratricopeptide repeat protein [Acidobacteria bacterium AH-259-G07]|nr:tetratricopeptide repeat protein [Acidobacteria bacterium AH-259-G07]
MLLEAALHKELVEGDLEQAIQLYKDIISKQGADRGVVAKALLKMGRCYEKLGKPEAHQVYEQVLGEYPDQPEPARLASERLQRLKTNQSAGAEKVAAAGPTYRPILDKGLRLRPQYWLGAPFDFSPSGGEFVFQASAKVGSTIRSRLDISDDTGTLIRPLVADFETWFGFRLPRWSPDGQQIAYVAQQRRSPPEDVAAIFVVSPKGGQARQIGPTFPLQGDASQDLCWTPDGRHLTYLCPNGIYTLALDGSDPQLMPRINVQWTMVLGGYSPDGRWLAFHRMQEGIPGEIDLWILPAQGGRALRLTHAPGIDVHPAWSRDGRALYFVSSRGGYPNLWKLQLDTKTGLPLGEAQQVTFFSDAEVKHPRLFADGRQMAFALEKRSHEIWIADVAHPEAAKAVARGSSPRLSPDGRTVYYIGEGPDQKGIFAVPREGGTAKRLTESEPLSHFYLSFDLSPDGRTLAYYADEGNGAYLYTLSANGGTPRRRMTQATKENLSTPHWSPDGSQLAYTHQNSLFVLPAQGGQPRKLADLYIWAIISWSPDGKHIGALAYARAEEEVAVFVVSSSGGEPKRLTAPEELGYKEGLAWHPDSQRLAYMRYLPKRTETGADSELRQVYLDGRPSSLLINQPEHWDYIGTWAPDGNRFFFLSYPANGEGGLYIHDLESKTTKLFASGGGALPTWSGDGETISWVIRNRISQLWLMENFR